MVFPFEKRRHPRIDLSVPVKLVQSDPRADERVMVGNAVTLNVSARGVYIRTFSCQPLAPGMRVGVRISVPESVLLGTKPAGHEPECLQTTLRGTGRIVRVDRVVSADVVGVGVAIEFDQPLEFARYV